MACPCKTAHAYQFHFDQHGNCHLYPWMWTSQIFQYHLFGILNHWTTKRGCSSPTKTSSGTCQSHFLQVEGFCKTCTRRIKEAEAQGKDLELVYIQHSWHHWLWLNSNCEHHTFFLRWQSVWDLFTVRWAWTSLGQMLVQVHKQKFCHQTDDKAQTMGDAPLTGIADSWQQITCPPCRVFGKWPIVIHRTIFSSPYFGLKEAWAGLVLFPEADPQWPCNKGCDPKIYWIYAGC